MNSGSSEPTSGNGGKASAHYRLNAKPKCACGAFLSDAPLLSPSRGAPVCNACHGQEVRAGLPVAGPQDKLLDAARHFAIFLSLPKRDPLMAQVSACRRCGAATYVTDAEAHTREMGTSYRHACIKCAATFRTETIYCAVAHSLLGVVVLGASYAFWFSSGVRNNIIASVLCGAAAAIFGQRLLRIRNRWLAPQLPGPSAPK